MAAEADTAAADARSARGGADAGERAVRPRVVGRGIDGLAVLLALAVLAAWMRPAAARPLTWDEVDYVAAARTGSWANLTDRGALGPFAFLRFALAKAGFGDADAVAAAAAYDEDANPLNLRHWHPPGGLLPLPAAVAAAGPERGARLLQLFWAAVLAGLLFAALREIAPERPLVRALALLAVLLDPLTRHAVLEAHVHVAVAAAFLLPLLAWLRVTRDPLDARRLGALRERARPGMPTAPMAGRSGALMLGLALGALWAFAVVGPLWTVFWAAALLAHRDARDWLGREGGWRWALAGLLAALAALWPGAFLRLSLVQTYALRLYAVAFQGGKEWSSAAAALGAFLRESPSLGLYALLGVGALARGLLRGRRDALAAGGAAVAFLVVILPFAILDRYLLPLLPLAAAAGAALVGAGDPEARYPAARDAAPPPLRAGASGASRRPMSGPAVVATGLAACWMLAPGFAYPTAEHAAALRREYARVDSLAARGEVLGEGGQLFRFYGTGGHAPVRSVLVDYDGRRLLLRRGVRYDTVSAERAATIVLQRRPPTAPEPEIFATLAARCRREDFPTHAHFACGTPPAAAGGATASASSAEDSARSAPRRPAR